MTPYLRQQMCGRCRAKRFGTGVNLTVSEHGVASLTGLIRCGSVWACASCAYVICRERAAQLREVLHRHAALGGGDCMGTLTTAHDLETPLKPMRQHIARAWSFVVSGAPWKRARSRWGIIGYVRGAEQTIGPNGWHAHLHVVFLTRRPLPADQLEALRAFVFKRWARAIAKPHKETGLQFRAPLEFGIDGRPVAVVVTRLHEAAYIAKLGLADELASGHTKRGAAGRRTPWQLLTDVWSANQSYSPDVERWYEYVTEMHGAKQLTWSNGLKKRYAVAEQTDLELAERDEEPGEVVCEFSDSTWDAVFQDHVERRIRVLQIAEKYQPDEARSRITRLVDRALGLQPVPF